MNPDPPFTATQIHLQRWTWVPGVLLLVLVILALVGLGTLLFGHGEAP
jgi:hypothetical protein